MSLSNPNKVVTEERLNEYHNAILPYLGGMPDILANKFSRADLYSTDEKMIGRWTDGKPLYQKVITNVSLPNGATTKAYAYSSYGITDVDMMMCPLAFVVLSGNTSIVPLPWVNSGNRSIICAITGFTSSAFSLVADSDRSTHKATFVLNYTKSTDSAVEIGLDTDYSTEEKIVGTWIDGKPIYQKVVNIGTLPSATSETFKGVSINTTVDTIVKVEGFIRSTSWTTQAMWAGYGGNTLYYIVPSAYNNSDSSNPNKVGFTYSSGNTGNWVTDSYVIVQYTKTTD